MTIHNVFEDENPDLPTHVDRSPGLSLHKLVLAVLYAIAATLLLGVFGVYIPIVGSIASFVAKAVFYGLNTSAFRFGSFVLLVALVAFVLGHLWGRRQQ